MQLIAIGGDMRVNGLLRAARKAGYDCRCVTGSEELRQFKEKTDVIVLPWPHSFSGEWIAHTQITREALLSCMPQCSCLMGGGVKAEDFLKADQVVDPSKDEQLLAYNARLTAEATVAALTSGGKALLAKTCLVTGFGRVARALVRRLVGMEAFVIVCARSEEQMQLAHRMGAHPLALEQLQRASMQADVVINTIPSRVFSGEALAQMKPDVRYIELASAPYGAEPEQAAHFGVSMEILGGLPGKYAPDEAGAALFEALRRAMKEKKTEGEAV